MSGWLFCVVALVVRVLSDMMRTRCPKLLCFARPIGGIFDTFSAQMLRRLGRLKVGRLCAGLFDHLLQKLGIFEHRARAQMVVVEGLIFSVGHKQRLLERVKQAHVADIRARIVDEHAGLDIAVGVDVAVVSAPAMHPPTNSPSFWKSMANMGFPPSIARISRTR